MKFRIHCSDDRPLDWWEDYEKPISDAQKWAEGIIKYFNRTLKPGERPRTLLGVEVIEESNDDLHDWVKSSAGMSASFRGRIVDLMFCSKCGITGKRYGFSSNITLDAKYRKKVYRKCSDAKKESNRHG